MYGEPMHYILFVLLLYTAGVCICTIITFVEKNCLRAVSFLFCFIFSNIYIYNPLRKNSACQEFPRGFYCQALASFRPHEEKYINICL